MNYEGLATQPVILITSGIARVNLRTTSLGLIPLTQTSNAQDNSVLNTRPLLPDVIVFSGTLSGSSNAILL